MGSRPAVFLKSRSITVIGDNINFWYTRFRRPNSQKIPSGKEADISTVVFAADRIDDQVKFSEDACAMLVKVPRIFLNRVLQACVEWGKRKSSHLDYS